MKAKMEQDSSSNMASDPSSAFRQQWHAQYYPMDIHCTLSASPPSDIAISSPQELGHFQQCISPSELESEKITTAVH